MLLELSCLCNLSDAEVVDRLAKAARDACRRGRLSETPVQAGSQSIPLDFQESHDLKCLNLTVL